MEPKLGIFSLDNYISILEPEFGGPDNFNRVGLVSVHVPLTAPEAQVGPCSRMFVSVCSSCFVPIPITLATEPGVSLPSINVVLDLNFIGRWGLRQTLQLPMARMKVDFLPSLSIFSGLIDV